MIQTDGNGLKKTPLYDYYVDELGAKLTDFSGWALPIQISKIQEEHDAVRNSVGLFDASHMGEVRVAGEGALEWLNGIVTNNILNTDDNQGVYTAVTNEDGGTLDDLIIFKVSDEDLFLTPNSGNYEKIHEWLEDHNDGDVEITDETADYGLIAIQGPNSEKVLSKLTDADLSEIKSYRFAKDLTVGGVDNVTISRTGYTGEDGFEIYIPWGETVNIWKQLVEAGEEYDIAQCALGARDTLRLEAGLALYGNDLSEDINPIEGGIGFAVKTGDKKEQDYPGKEALAEFRAQENKRQSRGFELKGRGIARPGMKVTLEDGTEIGEVTSGTKSPTFDISLGNILIDNNHSDFGNEVFIEVRNKLVPAEVVRKDWLRR